VAWTNATEGDRAPIAAAHYQVCRRGGSNCAESRRPGIGVSSLTDIAVPAPGEWEIRVWREDAAGNHEPTNASVPVPLRFDPEPPELAFEPTSPADPTLVSVAVTDRVSGLAAGQIELGRRGTGTWQAVSTERRGDRLVARIDDSLLPAGIYSLRATAWDQASNQNSTNKRLNGELMTLSLPIRTPTILRAGVRIQRTVTRSVKRRGKHRRVRKQVVELRPRVDVRYGERVSITGRLANVDGQPVPGAQVQVFAGNATDRGQLLGVVTTDAGGGFSYQSVADASRTLRFAYSGSAVALPAETAVSVLTSAASTIRAAPRRLSNGQSVRFSGKLRALPAPPAGKLVELQVVLSGRWQTFRTTRTQTDGSWSIRYGFRRTCGLLRYRFRAQLPAEAGYAFQSGTTRTVTVTVRGPRCR
jgi:hypothetical protein